MLIVVPDTSAANYAPEPLWMIAVYIAIFAAIFVAFGYLLVPRKKVEKDEI